MIKNLLFAATAFVALSLGANAQETVLFEDSFEDYADFSIDSVGDWVLVDVDQATYNYTIEGTTFPNQGEIPSYIVFNPGAVSLEGADAKTGNKYMAAFASYEDGGGIPLAVTQSDWLISPEIQLGGEGNVVSFWAKSHTLQYGAERFNVLVSTGSSNPDDFTQISDGTYTEASSEEWTEYSYDLSGYDGQTIRVAIQCVSNDSFIFVVDDFKVTTTDDSSTDNFAKLGLNVFPNPVSDIVNITSPEANIEAVTITDLNGRTVKSINFNNVAETTVDASDLASGIYLMNITANGTVATQKIVKK